MSEGSLAITSGSRLAALHREGGDDGADLTAHVLPHLADRQPNPSPLDPSLLMILFKMDCVLSGSPTPVSVTENKRSECSSTQANPSGLCELEGVVDEIAQDLRGRLGSSWTQQDMPEFPIKLKRNGRFVVAPLRRFGHAVEQLV